MKVRDLIEALIVLPADLEVRAWDDHEDDYMSVAQALYEDGTSSVDLLTAAVVLADDATTTRANASTSVDESIAVDDVPKRDWPLVAGGHPWRVGRKLARTIYFNDRCVGMVDTPGLAIVLVVAANERAQRAKEQGDGEGRDRTHPHGNVRHDEVGSTEDPASVRVAMDPKQGLDVSNVQRIKPAVDVEAATGEQLEEIQWLLSYEPRNMLTTAKVQAIEAVLKELHAHRAAASGRVSTSSKPQCAAFWRNPDAQCILAEHHERESLAMARHRFIVEEPVLFELMTLREANTMMSTLPPPIESTEHQRLKGIESFARPIVAEFDRFRDKEGTLAPMFESNWIRVPSSQCAALAAVLGLYVKKSTEEERRRANITLEDQRPINADDRPTSVTNRAQETSDLAQTVIGAARHLLRHMRPASDDVRVLSDALSQALKAYDANRASLFETGKPSS